MLKLKKETIEKLQQTIAQDFGRELTFVEAEEIARQLLGYFDTLAKINHTIMQGYEYEKQTNGN